MSLPNLIANRSPAGMRALVDALNTYCGAAIVRFNSEFGPRYFGRPPDEPIPTEPGRLTEFRTRLGSLIEYGLGVTIDAMLQSDYGEQLRLSFVPANQYPDFYVRGPAGEVLLRIDAKSLHDESAEYSARFDLPVVEIHPADDFILYVAWSWTTVDFSGFPLVYPRVLEGLLVPAIDIAQERDIHLSLRGGYFDAANRPRVSPSGLADTNFGKINRIVHTSRRGASDLSPYVQDFLEFTKRHADAVAAAAKDSYP
jgi:hypothetical protein